MGFGETLASGGGILNGEITCEGSIVRFQGLEWEGDNREGQGKEQRAEKGDVIYIMGLSNLKLYLTVGS